LSLKNKRILVTGGAGFVGSHLVDKLLEMKNKVIVLDNFDDFYKGKEKNIQHNFKNGNFTLVNDNILNYDVLASVMKKVDIVFHEAAQCGVRYSIKYPKKTHDTNITGTLNVLNAARQNGVKKVVYPSSSGIFGAPKYAPMDEDHPTNPNSPYGVTKLAAEKYCLAFNEVYGLDVVCLRYFSVYGPRGRPDQVIYAFALAIADGKSPVVFGDGNQTRDFTFVSDVVNATILAAEGDNLGGQVFNIGYGKEFTINDVFYELHRKLNSGVKPVYVPTYKGEFPRTLADNAKARRMLGWKPKTNLNEGLDRFVEFFTKVNDI
jgi:UDP-glucose 4-epimerase